LGGAVRCETVWEALEGASAAVLVTEWSELTALDWAKVSSLMAEPAVVFDGRNALDAQAITRAGLKYMGVGRPGSHREG
jgi:UDPglucose 6-dehydrogenase